MCVWEGRLRKRYCIRCFLSPSPCVDWQGECEEDDAWPARKRKGRAGRVLEKPSRSGAKQALKAFQPIEVAFRKELSVREQRQPGEA